MRIGSVLFNPFTKSIVGFVETDKVYSEATLEPEIVSRWMTPDPLTEEREWVNPYNFVQNNPIIRTDPTGLLDTYGVNNDGDVVWLDDKTYLDENGNEVDRLYAIDDQNNIVDSNSGQDFATAMVDDNSGSSFLKDLASDNTGVDFGVTQNMADAFDVFKFAADNSSVEWGLQSYKLDNGANSYIVGTSKSESYAFNGYHLGLSGGYAVENLLFDVHSHVGNGTASGYRDNSFPFTGDKERQFNHKTELDKKGLPLPLYYIYNNKSNELYRYTPSYGDKFIKKINRSSDFYNGKFK
ncbi:hypothetical protein LV716_17335 [Flagellimonas sp. HMM57]|uniref:JAB-like toxin 1 domain-containing protein n=1 Tax=unclassified Flagellimonas TaxID=2644544 RepID=UPI0013D1D549|nr:MULTISPECIES: JAB-like toxin 1 domain-containing protein [unclassified Flagellimonas]UII76006.1 hypothetical protein LV716_17335 [Flagellimonas sp. HMM57]